MGGGIMGILAKLFNRQTEPQFNDTEMKSELDARLHLQGLDLDLLALHCEHNKGTNLKTIRTHSHTVTYQFKQGYLCIGKIKPIKED
mgnify:CR=1 FL=1